MLKKIRLTVAVFFMAAVTLLFLDYTGTVHAYLGWTAKVQFVPALLAGNAAVIAGLLLLTLIFGRIYCSVICPLGLYQDKVSRIFGIGKKNRFAYRPPKKIFVIIRYVIMGIFAVAIVVNIPFVTALLEPYSAYGRMVSQIAGPLYKYGNNILAGFAERAGSYAFYSVDVWMTSAAALAVAISMLVIVGIFAAKSGRGYCNAVCPVGALLALVTKFSFVKPFVDREKCNGCGLCAKNCKAGCIDPVNKEIDYLRCVSCCNCIDKCSKKTIRFSLRNPFRAKKSSTSAVKGTPVKESTSDNAATADISLRNMIAGAAALALGGASSVIARTYNFDGGLAPLEDKIALPRKTPIIPPGADNIRNFRRRCTGCQLCVSTCPNQVLRPSSKLSDFMQPQMSFERGYCRPECVKCSSVCPTGAIRPITTAEKSSIQIGYAVWNKDLCVNITDSVSCDLCSRKCPTAAISLIPQKAGDESSPRIPMIDANRCIGCGACEQLCPSRPRSAIHIEGVETHRTI